MRQWQISIRLRAKCVYTSPFFGYVTFIGYVTTDRDMMRHWRQTEARQAMVRRLTKGVAPTRPVTNTRAQRRTNDPASGDDSEDVIRYQVSRSVLRRIYIFDFKVPVNFLRGHSDHGKSLHGHLIGEYIRCALQMLFAFQTNRSNDTTETFICLHKSCPRPERPRHAHCNCRERLGTIPEIPG